MGAVAVGREVLRAAVCRSVSADENADLETGLISALLRAIVFTRGSVYRAAVQAEVQQLISPLTAAGGDDLSSLFERELDAMVSIGEFALRQPSRGARVVVEPAAPAFVTGLQSDSVLLLGGALNGAEVLPERLRSNAATRGRARWLPTPRSSAESFDELRVYGLREVSASSWSERPQERERTALLGALRERLGPTSDGFLEGLEFFDPSVDSTFFKSRVRPLGVAEIRRACAAFGGLAGRARAEYGPTDYFFVSERVTGDLGATRIGSGAVGRSEWLRVAGATARRGHPLRASLEGDTLLLYFPAPMWLERTLLIGRPKPPHAGALRSDELPETTAAAVAAELRSLLFAEVSAR